VVADGQNIEVGGSGTQLGFVGAGSPADEGGPVTIYYTDGSTSGGSITLDNYFSAPDTGNAIVAAMSYCNDSSSGTSGTGKPGQRQHPVWIFSASVPITPGKTVQAVTLPTGGSIAGSRITGMHVFALGVG
jgi:hypothetical protein